MWRRRNVLSGRLWKILFVSLALLILCVLLPVVALAASDEGEAVSTGPPPSASGSGLQIATLPPFVFSDNVESGAGSWTAAGTWAISEEWAPTPTHSWSDSPGGDYADNTDSSLVSGAFDLSDVASGQTVGMSFAYSCALEDGQDFVYVEFSNDDGSTWTTVNSLTGTHANDSWGTGVAPAMLTSQFRMRFRLTSDGANTADGIHIDDVSIWSNPGPEVEDDDAVLAYYGNWNAGVWSPTKGNGTYKYSSTAGDLVRLSFDGTCADLIAKVSPQSGIARVSVDGGAPQTVDFYHSEPAYQNVPVVIYNTGTLVDGEHTLTIECTGTKNPASSGYGIVVDYFSVWGSASSSSGPTRRQETEYGFKFKGGWSAISAGSASGGAFTSCNALGSSANVIFDGTYLAWYAKKGAGYGKAELILDGGSPVYVDLYSSYDRYQQRVYNTGLLTAGSHTLSIYWIGQKNPAAWGTSIDVDAFDILGSLTPAGTAPPIVWRYQQDDSRVSYLGNWATTSTWSASGGSYASVGASGAAILVAFEGTYVRLLAKTAPWYGQALVSIDGDTPETVDFYSAAVAYKQPVYDKTISAGSHTLVIKCAGSNNASSSGYSISLDAVETGYLTQAEQPTRCQQDNGSVTGTGSWSTASTWSASGGSFAYANAAGCSLSASFDAINNGYLAWLATTGPGYGKAQVVVDGGAPVTVDLYSSTTRYKQRVYNTGLLGNGSHVVNIYWVGQKNPSAWGTTIGADAFDILGYQTKAPTAPPILWRYQQGDARLTYMGDWTTVSTWSASGGSFARTGSAGAAVWAQLTASTVKLIATTGPGYGEAVVNLNGSERVVDLYSATTLYKQTVYEETGLDDTTALNLTVKAKGTKNTSSSGYTINLDAIDTGYLNQAAALNRYQQDNSHVLYDGTWSTSPTNWSASGGNFKYANVSGAELTVNFNGCYVALIATTGPGYGKALVTLDSGTPFYVDLYSPTTKYKQRVYNTGLIYWGNHTLSIDWDGTKNSAAYGTTIDADAFDIFGDIL
jgi:hypothetical protein